MWTLLHKTAKTVFGGAPMKHHPRDLSVAQYKILSSMFCTQTRQGPNIEAITNGDKELEHKLKVLILEVDVMRQEGRLVPEESFLTDNHWKELLNQPSFSARRKQLEYLFKLGKRKENDIAKKEQKRLDWEEKKSTMVKKDRHEETYEDFVSTYDLLHNNIFLRFYDTTINQMYNNRLIQAMQFGQKMVVDCGYVENMSVRENKNCAKQMTLLFSENRFHDDPYDLHFCNADPNSSLIEYLHKHIPTMFEPWFPMNITEKSYLELFPKEKLVYLTPHCREELTEYDHDAIYIIGGIVDKINNEPLSLAKAKKEGIRMAKFPLDRYLQWGSGSGKSLALNQVSAIMLDIKHTGDWKYALRHVPKRKTMEIEPGQQTFTNASSRIRKPSWRPSMENLRYNNNSKSDVKPRFKKTDRIVRSIFDD